MTPPPSRSLSDAGVSLRTFYRHFASKHDLLFADYDAGLHWFRAALAARSPDESIIESVHSAILAFPYDVGAVTKIAALRARELDPGRIVRHIRQVEADFAEAVEEHLTRDHPPAPGTDQRLRITVTARCIAAAVFGAMEVWMLERRTVAARAGQAVPHGAGFAGIGHRRHQAVNEVSSLLTKLAAACQPQPMADYDAIVIGAGHNGLTAAAILQRAGLHTLCLDSKLYAGGMASTVELFDGYKFEIAGSLQFPTSKKVSGRTRTRRIAIRRPRRDVGVAAGHRRRPRHLLHRPDEAAHPSQRRARRRGRQRHGRPDGLESGADAGIRPLPAGSRETRRAAGNAGVPRRQHHLPRARHTGAARPRSRSGWRFPTRTPC